ncbi:MAG: stage V sporulation protein AD, partial [Alicyclobacillus sp.]|nr:stage V sporulation protein AD [Alicyclobacillus sp.]
MPRVGQQTWEFMTKPTVLATGTVAGKVEGEGPLGQFFDVKHSDDRMAYDSWEHAEQALISEAAACALKKAGLVPEKIDLLIGGDLNAQLTSFYFGLRSYPNPALGIYSACAS